MRVVKFEPHSIFNESTKKWDETHFSLITRALSSVHPLSDPKIWSEKIIWTAKVAYWLCYHFSGKRGGDKILPLPAVACYDSIILMRVNSMQTLSIEFIQWNCERRRRKDIHPLDTKLHAVKVTKQNKHYMESFNGSMADHHCHIGRIHTLPNCYAVLFTAALTV